MTRLIGQDAKEAHLLLLQGRVLIILEMEVVITYIISSTTFKRVVNSSVSLYFANHAIVPTLTFDPLLFLFQSTIKGHVPF